MDRCAQLATAAATLALEDAGGDLGLPHERIGASIGSAHGGIGTLDEAYARSSSAAPTASARS